MARGFRALSHLLPIVTTGAALLALAPGCSSDSEATPQAGVVWTVEPGINSSADCPVNGEDSFTIGSGGNDDGTVADGSTSGAVPIGVSCKVSGSDSSGYSVYAQVTYGTLGTLTIQGNVTSSLTDPQTGISGNFQDNLQHGLIADLSSTACTITYPNTQYGMGIAPGRIWGYIDCPAATGGGGKYTCDTNAYFRLENCSQ